MVPVLCNLAACAIQQEVVNFMDAATDFISICSDLLMARYYVGRSGRKLSRFVIRLCSCGPKTWYVPLTLIAVLRVHAA